MVSLSSASFQGDCFQFLPVQYDVGCGFVVNIFYYLEIRSIDTQLLSVFSIKSCRILSKAFSASIEMIMWFLSLVLFMWWITFINLHTLDQPCHPQDEAYLVMMDKLFDVLLHSVCQYFIEDCRIDVHHGYWPEVFFFSCVSARFWYQDDIGLIKWVREDYLFLYCLE